MNFFTFDQFFFFPFFVFSILFMRIVIAFSHTIIISDVKREVHLLSSALQLTRALLFISRLYWRPHLAQLKQIRHTSADYTQSASRNPYPLSFNNRIESIVVCSDKKIIGIYSSKDKIFSICKSQNSFFALKKLKKNLLNRMCVLKNRPGKNDK